MSEIKAERQVSDDRQVEIILEQVRQDVKRIVQQERAGEKISPEIIDFRMR